MVANSIPTLTAFVAIQVLKVNKRSEHNDSNCSSQGKHTRKHANEVYIFCVHIWTHLVINVLNCKLSRQILS